MNLLDTIGLAISNLWRRKLRTFLTVLGVIIGTACIIIMVALGLGSLEQFSESILQSTNLTRIQIYAGYGMEGEPKLNEAALASIKEMEGVKSATGVIEVPAYILMGKYESGGVVYAVDPDAMNFEFQQGAVFSDTTEIEIVLGSDARQNFYDPRDMSGGGVYYSYGYGVEVVEEEEEAQIGPDVEWLDMSLKYYPTWYYSDDYEATPEQPAPKQYKAKFSGILAPSDDYEISYGMYISQAAAKKVIRENRKLMDSENVKEDTYSQMYVNAVDVDAVEGLLAELKTMGYQASSPTEWITSMQDEYSRQQGQLIAIALISLLVSAIGIANTMLASILERRREIGVMKVIGLSIGKINLMFLVEAALIGILGGLIAIAASYIVAAVANMGTGEAVFMGMYFTEGIRLTIPWWLALGALAISAGVGIVSGIYPAWRATRMSPLEAIRGAS